MYETFFNKGQQLPIMFADEVEMFTNLLIKSEKSLDYLSQLTILDLFILTNIISFFIFIL